MFIHFAKSFNANMFGMKERNQEPTINLLKRNFTSQTNLSAFLFSHFIQRNMLHLQTLRDTKKQTVFFKTLLCN